MKKNILLLFVVAIVVCFIVFLPKRNNKIDYHLRLEGYSNGKLLYIMSNMTEPLNIQTFLGYLDLEINERLFFTPLSPGPFDFTWSNNGKRFLVTHGDRITIYDGEENEDLSKFTSIAVSCPVNVLYTYCTTNTDNMVAVNSYSMAKGENVLGIYDFNKNIFSLTNILISSQPVFWKSNEQVVFVRDDKIHEVNVSTLSQSTIGYDADCLYGIIDGKLVYANDNIIKLNEFELCSIEDSSDTNVLISNDYIFVSPSKKTLSVFNNEGEKVGYIEADNQINLGSLGKYPNVIYACQDDNIIDLVFEGNELKKNKVLNLSETKLKYNYK